MDQSLAQIINDLIAANQEIARLRQENEQLRANQKPPVEGNGQLDKPSAGQAVEAAKTDST